MIIIRMRLSPGLPTNCFCGYRDWGAAGTPAAAPRGSGKVYRDLAARGARVPVGMEASGHASWFERMLAELQFELWVGDATEILTKRVRKQKTDRQDAQLLLRLLIENRFPQIWVSIWENRDLRQLPWHRHRVVQARMRIMNQLQTVGAERGLCSKKKLWQEAGRKQLESFGLAPWANRRRQDLLELLDRLSPKIAELTKAIARGRPRKSQWCAVEHREIDRGSRSPSVGSSN